MLYQRPRRFLSPLLILVLLSGLAFAPLTPYSASAQSRSKRSASARTTKRTQRRAQAARRTAQRKPTTTIAAPTAEQTELGSRASEPAGDADIRADLPLGGELRIENRRGNVSVEVWNEQHVSVTAKVAGRSPARSPVVIQRTESLLKIGVVSASGRTAAATARVDLMLRIPERSRTEINTLNGEVLVRGLPALLAVKTAAGDISAELPSNADADVVAETKSGSIDSTLPTVGPTGTSERDFHATLGAGGRAVTIRSERGSITLSPTAPTTSISSSAVTTASSAPSPQTPRTETPRVDRTTEDGRRLPTLGGAGTNGQAGAGTPASASTDPQEVDEGDVVRVDTELVTLNVSVVSRNSNRGLPDLKQKDFRLYEDGAEQQIEHFNSSAAPFNLVLLIDLSGSTKEVVGIIRNAALRFVAATRPADRIAVVTFANQPVVVSRLTDDRDALRRRISSIEEPVGSTKVYDSIAFTMSDVLKDAGPSRRNAIVLMSDGLDSTMPNVTGEGSAIDYRELLGRVQEFDGVFYSLWLNTEYEALSDLDVQPETVDLAHDRMKELADAGGGMFYEVEKLEDLAGAYERVVADLGTLYSLGYRPTNRQRDGKWRAIRIAVARPEAVARGKRGYYAN